MKEENKTWSEQLIRFVFTMLNYFIVANPLQFVMASFGINKPYLVWVAVIWLIGFFIALCRGAGG